MSRRQSLKNSATDSTSHSSLKLIDENGIAAENSKHKLITSQDDSPLISTVDKVGDNEFHSKSVEELRKELSKLSTRKISKSSTALKNSSSGITAANSAQIRKTQQLQRNPSLKLNKNTSARLAVSRMDSKTSLGRMANANAIKEIKASNSERTNDSEDEQRFSKWLESRNFLFENPFSLHDFEHDTSFICCHQKTCCSRYYSKAIIGKPAPKFNAVAVSDGEFITLKLADFRGKFVVLFFYSRDFTFLCPTEICAFSDRIDDFLALNAQLIACSTDSQFSHLNWLNLPRKEGGLGPIKLPLLADVTHQIAKDYGVFKEDDGLAFRGLFIIDKKGILRHITVNDLQVGRSVDETLRIVQAIQYADEHGELCPVGWRPGKQTIKPGAEKEYFEKIK